MANIKFIFQGTNESESNYHELKCYCNFRGEIYLHIDDQETEPSYICLDVPTAIKLAKVLRQEINTAKEVCNG